MARLQKLACAFGFGRPIRTDSFAEHDVTGPDLIKPRKRFWTIPKKQKNAVSNQRPARRSYVDPQPYFQSHESSGERLQTSADDFDIESRELAALARRYEATGPSRSYSDEPVTIDDGSLASRLGLKVHATNSRLREQNIYLPRRAPLASQRSPENNIFGRYGLQALSDHLGEGAAPDPFDDAKMCQAGWSPYASNDNQVGSSATGKSRCGSIEVLQTTKTANDLESERRDIELEGIDWNPVKDGTMSEAWMGYERSSLRDSAAPLREDSIPSYDGKGKAPATGDMRGGRNMHSDAFDYNLANLEDIEGQTPELLSRNRKSLSHSRELGWHIPSSQIGDLRYQQEIADTQKFLEAQERMQLEIDEIARQTAAPARLRTCPVCSDTKDPLSFPAKAPTPTCPHPPQTCTHCLQHWLASEFSAKGCEAIKCPDCPRTLTYLDIHRAASPETFTEYDKIATRNALASLTEFAWCLDPHCGSGQLNVENKGFMECVSCGYQQCLEHRCKWHKGETCEQYTERVEGARAREEEAKTVEVLRKISKACPNVRCGWRIEKVGGCEHMTCRRCRHEFCWQCLAAQSEIQRVGNEAHERWCKFHSSNLEVTWPFNVH